MCWNREAAVWSHFDLEVFEILRKTLYLNVLLTFLTLNTLRTAKVEQVKFDVMELHARPELAAQQRMVDDGSGDVKVG